MKPRVFLISVLAISAMAAACKPSAQEEDLGLPKVRLSKSSMEVPISGAQQELKFLATREWVASSEAEWIAIDPSEGRASMDSQKVVISFLDNSFEGSLDRTGKVTFDIGFASRDLAVSQPGHLSPSALILYSNNFDKEPGATSTPFSTLDKSDCWKNATGSNISAVEYGYTGVSVRNNSNSNGSYSDYEGSGTNNLFFGTSSAFCVKNIGVTAGTTAVKVSFGTEKYDNNNKTALFSYDEFPVYMTIDGKLWSPIIYSYAGIATAGRWNIAQGIVNIPEGTTVLGIGFKPGLASAYRVDDLKIEAVKEDGNTIDWATGSEMDFGKGNDTPTTEAKDVTIAEFIAAEVSTTQNYRISGTIGEVYPNTNAFDLTDGTNTIQVFQCSNFSEYSPAKGGTATVVGLRSFYAAKNLVELTSGKIEKYTAPGQPPVGETVTYKKVSAITSGKKYLIAALSEGKYLIGNGLAADKSYGYLYNPTTVTANGDVIEIAPSKEEFTFTASGSGYTIKQWNGSYIWMDGTYNSFQASASASAGNIWTVSFLESGAKILNVDKNKWIQYSVEYSSYGCYDSEQGLLPVLFERQGASDDPGHGDDDDPEFKGGTYSYEFASKAFDGEGKVALGGLSWTVATDGGYFGYNSTNGEQVGSKSKPAKTFTMSTTGYPGKVAKIVVTTSGASGTGATLSVSVGGTAYGTSASLTNTSTAYTFEPSSAGTDGEIKLEWAQSTSVAIYVKKIEIFPLSE